VCDALGDDAAAVHSAIEDAVFAAPATLASEVAVELESCTVDGFVVVVRSGTVTLRRRMTRSGSAGLTLPDRVGLTIDAMIVTVANTRGLARPTRRDSLVALSAPPIGHPATEDDAAVGPSIAQAPHAAEAQADSVDAIRSDRADDPENERLTVALDGGLRLFRGGTGAYSFRIRTAFRWMFVDYRFLTTTVAGISVGDDARLSQQSIGVGVRHRILIGSRSTLSLGGSIDLGLSRAQGRTPGGSRELAFGVGTIGLSSDVLLEVGAGRARFHVGLDAGVQRGIVAQARDDFGTIVTLGSFNGLHVGLFAGVGIAALKEGGRR